LVGRAVSGGGEWRAVEECVSIDWRQGVKLELGRAVLPLAESSHKVLLGTEGCVESTMRRI
jgi:hypothetical protein